MPGLAISPILEDLSRIFPSASELEIQMLTSFPSLLIIPFVLLSGWLAGQAESLKLLAVGLAIFFASGIVCIFAKDIRLLIVASCIMGAGAGIAVPYSTGLVVRYFTGDSRVRQLGISSAVNNLSLVLATAVVGWIATRDWHLAFTVYLLPAVSMILLLALRSVKSAPEPKESDQLRQSKIHWTRLTGLSVLYFIITFTTLVITFYLSFLLEKYHFPQEMSSVMISLFFLAIMAPGFILNRIISLLGSAVNLWSLIVMGLGLVLMSLPHPSFTLLAVGAILAGLGYGVMQPIIYDKAATNAPPHLSTLALSLVMVMNYLAILIAPFITDGIDKLFHTSSHSFAYLTNGIMALILALIALFVFRRNRVFGSDD